MPCYAHLLLPGCSTFPFMLILQVCRNRESLVLIHIQMPDGRLPASVRCLMMEHHKKWFARIPAFYKFYSLVGYNIGNISLDRYSSFRADKIRPVILALAG